MAQPTPMGYSVAETITVTSLSRATIFRLIAAGDLRTTKVGKRTIVLADSIEQLLARGVERVGDTPTEESVAAERTAQGLPATVEDPSALAAVEAALGSRSRQPAA